MIDTIFNSLFFISISYCLTRIITSIYFKQFKHTFYDWCIIFSFILVLFLHLLLIREN